MGNMKLVQNLARSYTILYASSQTNATELSVDLLTE